MEAATGNCFEMAVEFMEKYGGLLRYRRATMTGLRVCHGEVTGQGKLVGVKFGHGWVEQGDLVFDYSNGRSYVGPKAKYYAAGQIDETKVLRYTVEQVRRKCVETGVYGPWDLQTSTGL
jgi:hypothetical protein